MVVTESAIMNLQYFLKKYLKDRPLFLSIIRAKEAWLFQKYLPLKKPVLDVGCGDGFFAEVAFGRINIGLDVRDSRMRLAKNYERLLEFDGINIPLKKNSVNTAVSNCVLEHVEELGPLLKDIYRVLRPRGTFLTTVMAKPWEENMMGALIMGVSYKNWMRQKQVHLNLLTNQKWREKFNKAGFIIKEEIGYLDVQTCRLIEIAHYLSVPSLISYVLFKKWVMWPNFIPTTWLASKIGKNTNYENSGAIFFVLEKK